MNSDTGPVYTDEELDAKFKNWVDEMQVIVRDAVANGARKSEIEYVYDDFIKQLQTMQEKKYVYLQICLAHKAAEKQAAGADGAPGPALAAGAPQEFPEGIRMSSDISPDLSGAAFGPPGDGLLANLEQRLLNEAQAQVRELREKLLAEALAKAQTRKEELFCKAHAEAQAIEKEELDKARARAQARQEALFKRVREDAEAGQERLLAEAQSQAQNIGSELLAQARADAEADARAIERVLRGDEEEGPATKRGRY